MAALPTDNEPTEARVLRDRGGVFRLLATVDDLIYGFERAFVTLAIIIMTGVLFIEISYDYLHSQQLTLKGLSKSSPAGAVIGLVVLGCFVAGMYLVSFSRMPAFQGKRAMVLGATIGGVLFTIFLGWGLLTFKPPVVLIGATLACTAVALRSELRRPRPEGEKLVSPTTIAHVGFVLTTAVVLIVFFAKAKGYSWAQNVALTLLLWMAFIGASMATHQKRHLAVDAVRKAVPKRYTRIYNGLSYLVSAAFTFALLLLAWKYYQLRLGEQGEPGRVPDHIKVLSIPFSLALIVLRFGLYGVAEFIIAALKLDPDEDAGEGNPTGGDVAPEAARGDA